MNHKKALSIVLSKNINLSTKTVRLCMAYRKGTYTLQQLLWDLDTYRSPIEQWENDPVERWVNDCAFWSFHAAQVPHLAYKAIANLVLLEAFTSL